MKMQIFGGIKRFHSQLELEDRLMPTPVLPISWFHPYATLSTCRMIKSYQRRQVCFSHSDHQEFLFSR